MFPCNTVFFYRCISRKADDLHPVQKRFRDRIRAVRRTDKQYIAEVIRDIHIMIGERIILLRIQHLQQSTRRIAAVITAQLVHFIQHHDGICGTALLDPVHDPARHGADIGAPVPADLRLITHTAKAHPDILPMQSLCDTLSDTGLPGTRCAHKQKDRAGLAFFQIHHRDLLQHAVFYLFQTVMILIQDLFRLLEIDLGLFFCFPGQTGHEIQIIIEHPVFVAVLTLLLHAV